ncbi:DNA-(apurinic or apyrimidinic site) endonuclease 2 [Amblyraja radiata]|uniref:DNA-(apurinic or apyrimidinic site) endonuclease 2 n=1 Tax=Amblyraja radiata TaxID=386614 RepID=UPI00140396FE|nr:DNA-(apurinic or apyrimidinic site) endonuclease 2 [Amblyraja radiata]
MKPGPRLRLLPAPGAGPGRLRLLTWNVNGLRTLGRRLRPRLETMRAEISCFQETRVSREGLTEELAVLEGFTSYFSHSRTRPGYSGVATYCRDEARPFWAEEGLSGLLTLGVRATGIGEEMTDRELRELDSEGRAVITKHRVRLCEGETATLAVVNVYVPRADPDCPPRQRFKLRFLQLLEARVNGLLQEGEHVIVLGDLNIAHRPIDHCDPGDLEQFAMDPSRQWLDRLLSPASGGPGEEEGGTAVPGEGPLVDGYRLCQPARHGAYTCWRVSTGARATNYGARIDYLLVSRALARRSLARCALLPGVTGSDHCPVVGWFTALSLPSPLTPPLCTSNMPEFTGVQQKLVPFLVRRDRGRGGEEGEEAERREAGEEEVMVGEEGDRKRLERGGEKGVGRGRGGVGRGKGKGTKSKVHPAPAINLLSFFKPIAVAPAPPPDPAPPLDLPPSPAPPLDLPPSRGPAAFWKVLLGGRPPPPLCTGHGEPSALRTVRKSGPNKGRGFYCCPLPQGPPGHPSARCTFFRWAERTPLPHAPPTEAPLPHTPPTERATLAHEPPTEAPLPHIPPTEGATRPHATLET